jgi:hypothetical protein
MLYGSPQSTQITFLYLFLDTLPFTSSLGARQGDVLNPNILKLFLNDFSDIIENSNDSVYLQDKNISCLLYVKKMQHSVDIWV